MNIEVRFVVRHPSMRILWLGVRKPLHHRITHCLRNLVQGQRLVVVRGNRRPCDQKQHDASKNSAHKDSLSRKNPKTPRFGLHQFGPGQPIDTNHHFKSPLTLPSQTSPQTMPASPPTPAASSQYPFRSSASGSQGHKRAAQTLDSPRSCPSSSYTSCKQLPPARLPTTTCRFPTEQVHLAPATDRSARQTTDQRPQSPRSARILPRRPAFQFESPRSCRDSRPARVAAAFSRRTARHIRWRSAPDFPAERTSPTA